MPNEDTGALEDQGWNTRGLNSVIYKLMRFGQETTLNLEPSVFLTHFESVHFSQAGSLRTYGGGIPLVCVYRINYQT